MIIGLCDTLMLLTCTLVTGISYRRMFRNSATVLVDLVVVVVYMFMCLPIVFNYIVGIPEYETAYWYKVFLPGMADEGTVFLYDFFVSFVMLVLYFYGTGKAKKPGACFGDFEIGEWRWVMVLAAVLPIAVIVLSGNLPKYAIYADSMARGLDEFFVFLVNCSLFLSLFCFTLLYYSLRDRTKRHLLLLAIYTFVIAWISGKRFIVALALIMYLFAFLATEKDISKRYRLYRALPILVVALVAFSGFYMAVIKPLTNAINYDIYEMLRVDFGRDDVTKYVIYQTTVLGGQIVDYPGETVLSFILFFVPRQIWPTKPFQHYQYLTSSILGVPISQLPAGTTPSGFEMFFANFGMLGMPLFALALVGLIKLFDSSSTSMPLRLLGLALCLVLLTQSIDVYLVYVALAAVLLAQRAIMHRKAGGRENVESERRRLA